MDSPSTIGVALSHGFTGELVSVTPWADALREAGFRVSAPLLPGHGTSVDDLARTHWRDWYDAYEAAYLELAGECETVVAAGLSMGGALALRLAAHHPVGAVTVVNPALVVDDPRSHLSAVLRYVKKTTPGIHNDIKRPGQDEGGYDLVPVAAAHELKLLFRDTVASLPRATAPLQVFRSTVDRVVTSGRSLGAIVSRYGGTEIRLIRLTDSYHVATLDNDAPTIFDRSAAFIREVVGSPRPARPRNAAHDTREVQ
ncbi:esterase [Sinomonas cyclohexanicum]|uniref:Esterase n=1 Tax=Sinomonas cyclohexanicum TaxID=322009 RepID=A0ABM7PUI3_SINCY|nr:alpha/beta fold hydrolase [Corynebacterium cyclohexanicum]BCT75917.1 esterase [Corynebacterium cyclohexanicum]